MKDYPVYREVFSIREISDTEAVKQRIKSVDWSFTDEKTQYLSHDIHPYPAKFIPQIPGYLIANLSLRGEVVLDPFGGSGTTAFEALRLNRRAVSYDANPIATLIGQVKVNPLNHEESSKLKGLKTALITFLDTFPMDPEVLCQKYRFHSPNIPNRDKWFPDTSFGELSLIRSYIESIDSIRANNAALVALSRTVLKVSFQDSETRYASKVRAIEQGLTIQKFIDELDRLMSKVSTITTEVNPGDVDFRTIDARAIESRDLTDDSIDLIVTSPPYGNAYDYHLYHRFRLFWLGYDPKELSDVEIGSHLKHQRSNSGFESYLSDMSTCLKNFYRVLKPGRYAAMVIGDAIYEKVLYNCAQEIGQEAIKIGFKVVSIIERPIHQYKRSISFSSRRATSEKILLIMKPNITACFTLNPPPYKLWEYEKHLRIREISSMVDEKPISQKDSLTVKTDYYRISGSRRLVFTHSISDRNGSQFPTWQALLENGFVQSKAGRKDPKYITHGIHPYKGKFYPQLAKGLLNISEIPEGGVVLDPFCGSGTTLLESFLNGYRSHGCDLNPLAAKISRAKNHVLCVDTALIKESYSNLINILEKAPIDYKYNVGQFDSECIKEIESWFPKAVISKINWLLETIRSISAGSLLDYYETILSSIIRNISYQDPHDLRIRRRKDNFSDADVVGIYIESLSDQYKRLEHFWGIKNNSPVPFYKPVIAEGDSRDADVFSKLGLSHNSVDLVLTSPPYSTALPYIDTDRLSLLVHFGHNSSRRKPIEEALIGTREISIAQRKAVNDGIRDNKTLPISVKEFLLNILEAGENHSIGFRKKNVPSLLFKYFMDMQRVMGNCYNLMKDGGKMMIVIGDSYTTIGEDKVQIESTAHLLSICTSIGLQLVETIPISVTTDNHKHIANAIKTNTVLILKK